MEVLGMIVIAAVLVEAVTTAIKPIWDADKRKLAPAAVASLLIGLVLSFAANLDLPGAVGMTITWPVVSQIITGIVISRGANYVYDIIDKIKQ